MVLMVKNAFISLYSNKSFIDSYHTFILEYIRKTGNIITIVKSSNDEIKEYVVTDKDNIIITAKPQFATENNDDLKLNILGSQYFIN